MRKWFLRTRETLKMPGDYSKKATALDDLQAQIATLLSVGDVRRQIETFAACRRVAAVVDRSPVVELYGFMAATCQKAPLSPEICAGADRPQAAMLGHPAMKAPTHATNRKPGCAKPGQPYRLTLWGWLGHMLCEPNSETRVPDVSVVNTFRASTVKLRITRRIGVELSESRLTKKRRRSSPKRRLKKAAATRRMRLVEGASQMRFVVTAAPALSVLIRDDSSERAQSGSADDFRTARKNNLAEIRKDLD